MKKYLLDKSIIGEVNNVFVKEIDLQKIYENGFFDTALPKVLSDSCLRAINKIDFSLSKSVLFRSPVMTSKNSDEIQSPALKMVVNSIFAQSLTVLSLFDTEMCPLSADIEVFKLVDGDSSPWSTILPEQAALAFYIIFKEDGKYESDYPLIEFAVQKYNEDGSIIKRESLEQIKLRDDSLVVFYDPCNFNIAHRISEIFPEDNVTILHGVIGDLKDV